MTLAYIVSRFPVLTETFILREICSLQQMGWPIEVFALRHMREGVRHAAADQVGEDVHYASAGFYPSKTLLRVLRMTLAGHRSSPQALAKALMTAVIATAWARHMRAMNVRHIHAHFGSYPALAAFVAAELQGISFSFTVHAHDLFADNAMLSEKAHHARFVIAISEFNRRRLTALVEPEDAKKVHVNHCGVNPDIFPFVERPQKAQHSLLTVAALREYKGLRHLVEACRMLRGCAPELQFVCHIVGEGSERQALERQIAAGGLQDIVRLEGATDEVAVRGFLRRSDVFVLPSVVASNGYMDGIPVALMEAMACGVPVIASRLSGIPELVRDGDTGLLVPPARPEALCSALLRTWSEPTLTARRARCARTLIEREYNLHETTRQLARFFRAEDESEAHRH